MSLNNRTIASKNKRYFKFQLFSAIRCMAGHIQRAQSILIVHLARRIIKIAPIFTVLISLIAGSAIAQVHSDQNGLRTSVIELSAGSQTCKRFEIANVSYNSYHWQNGGIILIELYNKYYATGYDKYTVEVGYFQGANSGSPTINLIESLGVLHDARISIGTPSTLSSEYGGFPNLVIPIYCDLKTYSSYKIKITYLRDRVDFITDMNQIKINEVPAAVNIDYFNTPAVLSKNIYISGNIGIGTNDTKESRLAVAGGILAESIKIKSQHEWPDYVFEDQYKVPSIEDVEKYIKQHKHLPGIPSSSEIRKNGIDLTEMNILLLKKIEELTLYIIKIKNEHQQGAAKNKKGNQ